MRPAFPAGNVEYGTQPERISLRPTEGPTNSAKGGMPVQRWLLRRLFRGVARGAFAVRWWDGDEERFGDGRAAFRLVFHRPPPLGAFLRDPLLAFGEAYVDGILELHGDLADVFRLARENDRSLSRRGARVGLWRLAERLRRSPSPARNRRDVQHHYDLGNDFFSLWLDDTMTYSCAYFRSQDDSLTQAQVQKMDHVLAKLQLRPGESLLDIGSGWGGLVIRAAQHWGARAVGITLSEEQHCATVHRVRELGLEDRVEVALMDYRALAGSGRVFDKIASVGMFEHVGRANHPAFMAAVSRLLAPGGLALLHTITHTTEGPPNAWLNKYIFPGGCVPSLREVIRLLPAYDFHVLDVESLRLHYALTLDRWAERFEARVDRVRDAYGERFVRMWRLYLRASAASFRTTGLDVHQILFSKGLNNALPLTREHLHHPRRADVGA